MQTANCDTVLDIDIWKIKFALEQMYHVQLNVQVLAQFIYISLDAKLKMCVVVDLHCALCSVHAQYVYTTSAVLLVYCVNYHEVLVRGSTAAL